MHTETKRDYFYSEKWEERERELPSFGPEDIIYSVKRFWKILVTIIFLGGAAGYYYSGKQPPMYESTTKVIFFKKNYFTKEKRSEPVNMDSYIEIAKSNSVIEAVIEKYNLRISPGTLRSRLYIIPVRGNEFLDIKYKDIEPGLTAIIANEIAVQFVQKSEEIYQEKELAIFEKAKNPESAIVRDKVKSVLSFMGIGFIMGMSVIGTLEYFTKKLKKPKEIEKILGIEILGSIPDFEKNREEKKNDKRVI